MEEKFIKILYELIVIKKLGLKESLEVIGNVSGGKTKSAVEKCGSFLLKEMMQGTTLCGGMRKCPFINFHNVVIAFVNYGEKTGDLINTVTFLYKRSIRKRENSFKVLEASIYPFLVILIAVIGTFFFLSTSIINFSNDIYFYLGGLIFIAIFIFLGIKKVIGENKLYEAFLSISFLVKGGINLYDAVGCGIAILGENSKLGIKFQQAREKLLFGMDLQHSFSMGKKYSTAFFIASKTGGKNDVFEKIARFIEDEDEKKRKVCLSLIEPVFILITGMFLIIIVVNFFLPYLTDMSLIK